MSTSISRLPSGKFYVRVRAGRQYVTGATFATRAVALEWARQQDEALDRRGAGLVRAQHVEESVGELVDAYLAEHVARLKSVDSTAYRVAGLRTAFGDLHYNALTPDAVAAWIARRLQQVTGETVRREVNVLSSFLSWCVRVRRLPPLPENPLTVPRPPPGRARDRRLVGDELKRLLEALGDRAGTVKGARRTGAYRVGTRNPWMRPLVQLAIETAMRQGEPLALRWENVDLTAQTAHLDDTKNGEARTVPLPSRAVAVLEALPRTDDPRVFPITSQAVKLAWKRACKRAGIEELHFHDLRHEAASRIAERLPNLIELAAVTGHKDLRMLTRYYHPRAADLAKKLG
ncbi:site-specific integrase [Metallibacterium sp.]